MLVLQQIRPILLALFFALLLLLFLFLSLQRGIKGGGNIKFKGELPKDLQVRILQIQESCLPGTIQWAISQQTVTWESVGPWAELLKDPVLARTGHVLLSSYISVKLEYRF